MIIPQPVAEVNLQVAGGHRVLARQRREHRDRDPGRGEPATVIHWRDRYAEGGLAALEDRQRSGRPPRVDAAQVVVATLTPPPQRLGVTHWSSRLLADELCIGFATVARIWRKWDLQP